MLKSSVVAETPPLSPFGARTTDYLLNPRVLRSAQSIVAANTPKATAISVAALPLSARIRKVRSR